jgi:CRISPR/Cas system CSM-associated protein Csm4 (group 5 of RAMP superfamily)
MRASVSVAEYSYMANEVLNDVSYYLLLGQALSTQEKIKTTQKRGFYFLPSRVHCGYGSLRK